MVKPTSQQELDALRGALACMVNDALPEDVGFVLVLVRTGPAEETGMVITTDVDADDARKVIGRAHELMSSTEGWPEFMAKN